MEIENQKLIFVLRGYERKLRSAADLWSNAKSEIRILNGLFKGQLISKAIYGLLTSPKKQTDKVSFAFLLFTANKSNFLFVFWENLRLTDLLFGFISPLAARQKLVQQHSELFLKMNHQN